MKDFVEEYRNSFSLYELFGKRLESLLVDIVQGEEVKIHFSESRAKSPESLRNKISRPGKSYDDPANQISDLVGVRLVLYYQDDVEKVGEMIGKEFQVLEEERSHLVEKYSPDQFGYLSAHYIIKLNEKRAELSEWRPFQCIHAEIQIRTVLQHSWAAVSHALQYKREGDVPLALRRKLFRLAGIFELADEQFIEIRDERIAVDRKSHVAVVNNQQLTPLDASIVIEVVGTSEEFGRSVDFLLDMKVEFDDDKDLVDKQYIGVVVEECERLGIKTIEGLNSVIGKDYSRFFEEIFDETWVVSSPFVLFVMLVCSYDKDYDVEYLVECIGWSFNIAESVISVISEVAE